MTKEVAIDALRWALTGVFVLSALEKTQTLAARSAAWHPVMMTSKFRQTHARVFIAVALIADISAASLLVVNHLVGGPLAAALVLAYSWFGREVYFEGNDDCRCFWRLLRPWDLRSFLTRNGVLVLAGLAVGSSPTDISATGFGGGFVLIACGSVVLAHVRPRRENETLKPEPRSSSVTVGATPSGLDMTAHGQD